MADKLLNTSNATSGHYPNKFTLYVATKRVTSGPSNHMQTLVVMRNVTKETTERYHENSQKVKHSAKEKENLLHTGFNV